MTSQDPLASNRVLRRSPLVAHATSSKAIREIRNDLSFRYEVFVPLQEDLSDAWRDYGRNQLLPRPGTADLLLCTFAVLITSYSLLMYGSKNFAK